MPRCAMNRVTSAGPATNPSEAAIRRKEMITERFAAPSPFTAANEAG